MRSVQYTGVPPRVVEHDEHEFRCYNWALALLHLCSVVGRVVSSESKWPVYITRSDIAWVNNSTLSCSTAPCRIEVRQVTVATWHVETLVVLFHAPAVVGHVYAAMSRAYMHRLSDGRVPHRWIEYSVSASIMMVAILLLTGVTDIWTLLLAFTLCAVTQAMGYAGEAYPGNWFFFLIGSCLMVPPWVVVYYTFYKSLSNGTSTPPLFVYYIVWSLFVLFMSFAVVNALQRLHLWITTPYIAERWYMFLSLFAKSALAWQIYFGALSRDRNAVLAYHP